MNDAKSILSRVTVRHRAPGYLRLILPGELNTGSVPAFLERGLHQLEGVRLAAVYVRQGKLSVHYDETVCEARDVARKLARLVDLLVEHGFVVETGPGSGHGVKRWGSNLRRRWHAAKARWQGRYRNVREQTELLLGKEMKAHPALRLLGNDPEKAMVNFLNDAVTFYLIKVHWNLIVQRWLRRPWTHRYEWLTSFYLIFLLVRSRRQGTKK